MQEEAGRCRRMNGSARDAHAGRTADEHHAIARGEALLVGLNDDQRAAGHRAHDDLNASVARSLAPAMYRPLPPPIVREPRNALTPALNSDARPERSDSLLIVTPRTLTTVAASISPAR